MSFSVGLAEAFDSNSMPELAVPTNIHSSGYSTLFLASSDYAHTSKRLRLAGNASTVFRYYQSLDQLDAVSHTVGVGANLTLPKRGSLQVDQSAAYAPAYLYQLFPVDDSLALGGSIPANPDYQIADNDSYMYSTRLALSYGSARGTMVTTSGTFSRTDTQQQVATYADLDTYEAGVQIAHRISSGGLSGGYAFRSSAYGSDESTQEHRMTVGANYTAALSRTRRVTFGVELTPTQFDGSQWAGDATDGGQIDAKKWLVSGSANVTYPFRPNWSASATYRRDTQYLSVLGQPVMNDAATVDLSGRFARRVELAFSAGYATAASVLSESADPLETYTGQVTITYPLKRSLSVYSSYLYYYYDQSGQDQLAPGLPAVFEQHGIRVGVTWFIEALGR